MALTLDEAPTVMTVSEAAEVLRMDRAGVYEAIRRGDLRALRSGRVIRVHRDALRRWLLGELIDREAG